MRNIKFQSRKCPISWFRLRRNSKRSAWNANRKTHRLYWRLKIACILLRHIISPRLTKSRLFLRKYVITVLQIYSRKFVHLYKILVQREVLLMKYSIFLINRINRNGCPCYIKRAAQYRNGCTKKEPIYYWFKLLEIIRIREHSWW